MQGSLDMMLDSNKYNFLVKYTIIHESLKVFLSQYDEEIEAEAPTSI